MKKKNIAWLLTAAMVATSVDGSVMIASGADFTSEPVENVQEAANEENEEQPEVQTAGEEQQTESVQKSAQAAEDAENLDLSDGENTDSVEDIAELPQDTPETENPEASDAAEELQEGADFNSGDTENAESTEEDATILTGITIVRKPEQTFVEDFDFSNEYLSENAVKDQITIRAEYADGSSEELSAGDEDKNKESFWVGTDTIYDDDWNLTGFKITVYLEAQQTEFEVGIQSFAEYLQTLDKNTIKKLEPGTTEEISWTENRRRLYAFTPDKTATYVFRTDGDSFPSGFLYDSEGSMMEGSSGSNFTIDRELEAGETYYFIVRSDYEGECTIHFYEREEFTVNAVHGPEEIYGYGINSDRIEFNGVSVDVTTATGKKLTYTKGKGEFPFDLDWDYDTSYDDNYIYIKPGTYTTSVLYNGEEVGSFQFTVFTYSEYLKKKNLLQELQAGNDLSFVKNGGDKDYYHFKPEESGDYNLSTSYIDSEYDPDTYVPGNDEIRVMDSDGKCISQGNYGSVKIELEKGKDYYFEQDYQGSYSDAVNYKISLKKVRKVTGIKLSSQEITKYIDLDEIDASMLNSLSAELTFADGSKETVKVGTTTDDGIRVEADTSALEDSGWKAGSYDVKIQAGDQSATCKVNIGTFSDYLKNNSTELTVDKRTAVSVKPYSSAAYSVAAKESGYYTVDFLKHSSSLKMEYYDAAGTKCQGSIKADAGQNFYVVVTNNSDISAKALLTPKKEAYVLSKLTVIGEPKSKTYQAGIDYRQSQEGPSIEDNELDTDGLKVKAEYSDGKTEELTVSDKDRNGNKLGLTYESEYDETTERNKLFLKITLDGVEADKRIEIKTRSLAEYITDGSAESSEEIQIGQDKRIYWKKTKGAFYKFKATADQKIAFASYGDVDTEAWLYDSNGAEIGYADAADGYGDNFRIDKNLTAGKTYYLYVDIFGTSESYSTIKAFVSDTASGDASALSDLKITSAPQKTVYSVQDLAYDEASEMSPKELMEYAGLKVEGKDSEGKTVSYTYGEGSFPFTISAELAYANDKGTAVKPGEYPVSVFWNDKKIGTFNVKVLSHKDYLATITEVLNPGESVKSDVTEYRVLPSDLNGVYYYQGTGADRSVIYDSDGNVSSRHLGEAWQSDGKKYYIKVCGYGGTHEFRYEKVEDGDEVTSVKILTEPDLKEAPESIYMPLHLEGMTVEITLKDGTKQTVNAEDFSDMYGRSFAVYTEKGEKVSNYSDLPVGNNKLILKLEGKEVSFNVSVKKPADMAAKSIEMNKQETISFSDDKWFEIYSYTPAKDENCYEKLKGYNASDEKLSVYAGKGNGRWTLMYDWDSFEMKAGNTYYFVVCKKDISYIFDASLKLYRREDIGADNEEKRIMDFQITAPAKTEYNWKDGNISYDGMVVTVIYDDGSEKQLTVEEAKKEGISFWDSVNSRVSFMIPGNYEITANYVNSTGEYYNIERKIPITVEDSGMSSIDISEKWADISEDQPYCMYKFEVPEDGEYQMVIQPEDGENLGMWLDDRTDVYGIDKTTYSGLKELSKGTHYVILYNNGGTKAGTKGKLKLEKQQKSIVDAKISDNTMKKEFILGKDQIQFGGMELTLTYEDGTTGKYVVPEGFEGGILENGIELRTSDDYDVYSSGKKKVKAYLSGNNQVLDSAEYTVKYADDYETVVKGKSYTIPKENGNSPVKVYKLKGSDEGTEIAELTLRNASIAIYNEKGERVTRITSYYGNKGYIILEKGKTYYAVVEKDSYFTGTGTFSIADSEESKPIKSFKAADSDSGYMWVKNQNAVEGAKIEVTYTDGSKKILTTGEGYGYAFSIDLNEISGSGSFKGTIELGSMKTRYVRTVAPVSGKEIKLDQYYALSKDAEKEIWTYTPQKSGKYYWSIQSGNYVDAYVYDSTGNELVYREHVDLNKGINLIAGRTYYFRTQNYDKGTAGFILSQEPEVTASRKDDTLITYDGTAKTPEIEVSYNGKVLTNGRDYKITYSNNVNAGYGIAYIEKLSGGAYDFNPYYYYFNISSKNLNAEKNQITIEPIPDQPCTGKEITPALVIKDGSKVLTAGIDYTVAYSNNIEIGTAEVEVIGIGNYRNTFQTTFNIVKAPEKKLVDSVELNKTSANVTAGSSVQLSASVTPKNAADKTVSWKSSSKYVTVSNTGKVTVSSKAPGGTIVTITATANDEGKKSASCKIKVYNKITYSLNGGKQHKSNKTSFCKQTVKLYSPTRKGYAFGGWYTDKSLKKKITSISNKTTSNVTLYAKWTKVSACKAPAKVTLKNSKAKTMTVSVSSVSGAKGYEISYATNAKFTKAVKKVQTGRTLSVAKLSKGKTYYVRVRAYKVDSTGAKIYGKYSKTVKIKIAK